LILEIFAQYARRLEKYGQQDYPKTVFIIVAVFGLVIHKPILLHGKPCIPP
jgi:hypothetical protein